MLSTLLIYVYYFFLKRFSLQLFCSSSIYQRIAHLDNVVFIDEENVADILDLQYVDEANVHSLLYRRFFSGHVYTQIGSSSCLFVNPCETPHVHSADSILQYRRSNVWTRPPHAYAIAQRSYMHVIQQHTSACVVLHGEGGSGKQRVQKGILSFIGALQPTPCLLYTSPSPRDQRGSRMPSSA